MKVNKKSFFSLRGAGTWALLALLLLTFTMTASAASVITYKSVSTAYNEWTNLEIDLSAGVEEDDFLLAQITVEKGTDVSITSPAGWTLVRRDDKTTEIGKAIYYKFAGAAEPPSYTWEFSQKVAANGAILVYSGVDMDDPIIASSSNPGEGGFLLTALSVNAEADAKLVAFYGIKEVANLGSVADMETPDGMTERYNFYNLTKQDYTIMAADQDISADGPTGNRTLATDEEDHWLAQLIALRAGGDKVPPVLTLPANITEEATGPSGAEVNYSASATDDVDGPIPITCSPASGSTFALGETTVYCSATDAAGNTASGSFTVTVVDTTDPVLSLPENITEEATGADGAVVSFTATASDSVDENVPVSCGPASGTIFPLGTTTVTCSAMDDSGNTATGSFSVMVQDTIAPELDLPDHMTIEATGPGGADVSFAPTAWDIVDGTVEVTCTPASGSTFPIGTTTVNCSATDAHNNTANGSFTVTVQDTTAPALTQPGNLIVEGNTLGGANVTWTDPTATDLVDSNPTVNCNPVSGSFFALGGPYTVTCTATDDYGNTSHVDFTITVVDTTAPALTLPADITAEAEGSFGAYVCFNATAYDIVDGYVPVHCKFTLPDNTEVVLTSTFDPDTGVTTLDGIFPLGETTVNCWATDGSGNEAGGTVEVTVVDTTPPVLTLPVLAPFEATGPGGAVVDYVAEAYDLVDGSVTPICTPVSGSIFQLGTTTVNCSATDAAGNTANGSFNVQVVDTTPPALTLPDDITAEATGPSGAVVNFTASAWDIVSENVAVTCNPASGDTFPLGATTVNCSATDEAGNLGFGSFTVIVVDTTAPAVTAPGNQTAEATGPSGAAVSFSASALDTVSGVLPVTCTPASGNIFPLGTTTVNCSATDGAGNTGSSSFTVTVVDTTPPVLTLPANISVAATSLSGSTVSFSATATDIVDTTVPVSCSPASGSTFPIGPTTVNCSAADDSGNTANGSFTVTVTSNLYLWNRTTQPSTNTTRLANLPLSFTAPTNTGPLPNYDTNSDSAPGRLIQKDNQNPNQSDLTKNQNWRMAVPNGYTLFGDIDLTFFSGMKDFTTSSGQRTKKGNVYVYLRDCPASGSCTTFATVSLSRNSWHGGLNQWMMDTLTFAGVNRTFGSGRFLEVKIVVHSDSGDDMWFAYDTMAYPSGLIWP